MARPRSTAAHQAALHAAVELLFEVGVDGVTLEEVAARSGVARSTLYRHFGSKEELVVAAASSCLLQHPTPDTGSLEGDLRFLFDRFRQDEEAKRIPQLLALLLDASRRDPALGALLDALLEERRRPLRTVVQLAQLRGEISERIDLDTALAIIIGPFTHRRLIDGAEADDEFAETVLRAAIAGLKATAEPRAPLPVP